MDCTLRILYDDRASRFSDRGKAFNTVVEISGQKNRGNTFAIRARRGGEQPIDRGSIPVDACAAQQTHITRLIDCEVTVGRCYVDMTGFEDFLRFHVVGRK
jgi:hypothetical protein